MSYRCGSASSNHPTSAYNAAYTAIHSTYNITNNNCLTQAVKILSTYGIGNLPSPAVLGISKFPNQYYDSKLPSSFSSAASLTTATIGVRLADPLNGSYINTNPAHKTRPLTAAVYDGSNHLIFQATVTAKLVPGTDRYAATAPLDRKRNWTPNGIATAVLIKVRLDYTLFKFAPGFYLIQQGGDNAVSDTNLIVGDVNQDNAVNTTDYNLMMQCYSDLQPPKGPCPSTLKRASDLNDDGSVNGTDYNIMLRVLDNQGGG
jgi:hypothetical protein